MKNIYILYTLTLCSIIFSSFSAHAEALYASADIGLYGSGTGNNPIDNIVDNDHNLRGTGRLALGYQWDYCPKLKFALELGVNGFQNVNGKTTGTDAPATYHRFSTDLLAVADYYIKPCLDLFVKAGPVYIQQESSAMYNGNEISLRGNGITGKLVVGAGYLLDEFWSVNLSMHHEFEVDRKYQDIRSFPSATGLLIGLKYNFI